MCLTRKTSKNKGKNPNQTKTKPTPQHEITNTTFLLKTFKKTDFIYYFGVVCVVLLRFIFFLYCGSLRWKCEVWFKYVMNLE